MADRVKVEILSVVAAFLIYTNTFQADFVYDDQRAIVRNPDVTLEHPITSLLVDDYWGSPLDHAGSHGSYRPLTVLTFRCNYVLFGLHPWAYHVTNVMLHCVTTFLFGRAMKSLLNMSNEKTLIAGLLFALHPVHTEAVAGVVGRADILATMFCLATLLLYKNACDKLDSAQVSEKKVILSDENSPSEPIRCIETLHRRRNVASAKKISKSFKCKRRKKETSESLEQPAEEHLFHPTRKKETKSFLSGNSLDQSTLEHYHDSGCASDDSHTTTDTFDSERSSESGICGVNTSEKQKHGVVEYEGLRNGFDGAIKNIHFCSSVQSSSNRKESMSSNVARKMCLDTAYPERHNFTNPRKLNQKDKLPKKDNFLHKFSPHEKHRLIFPNAYVWMSLSFLAAIAAQLSKENGFCAFPICIVYDLLIRNNFGVTETLSALFGKETKMMRIRRRVWCTLSLAIFIALLRVGIPIALTRRSFAFPRFSPSDNPAAANEDLLTRTLTFNYLIYCNAKLLLFPATLSFDWSMESIPLVTSILDPRNLATLLLYFSLAALFLFIWKNLRTRDNKRKTIQSSNEDKYVSNEIQSRVRFDCRRSSSTSSEDSLNDYNSNDSNNNNSKTKRRRIKEKPGRSWKQTQGLSELLPGENKEEQEKQEPPLINVALLGGSVIVFSMLPASNFLFYVGFVLAERILYLPSVGVCMLLAEGFYWFLDGSTYKERRLMHTSNTPRKRVRSKIKPSGYRSFLNPDVLIKPWWGMMIIFLLFFCAKTWHRNLDWNNEMSLYSSGATVNPAKALGNLGNVLRSEGKNEEAEKAYKAALKRRANMADVHYNLGLLYQQTGRRQLAEESYRRAIQCRPQMALAHLNLGVVLAEQTRMKEAKEVYRRTATLDDSRTKDPRSHAHAQTSALYNLGCLLADEKEYEEAIVVFEEAIRRPLSGYKPHSLYNMLGQVLFHMKRLDEAEGWFKASLASKPNHIATHLTLARLLHERGRFDQAESLYRHALSVEPKNLIAHKHYSNFLSSRNLHLKAAELLVEIGQTDEGEKDYEIIFSAASVYRRAKLYDKAEEYYGKAVKIAPNLFSSHLNLGAILHLQGKYLPAKQSYLKALALEPDNKLLLENLSKLERLLKDTSS